MVVRWDLQTIEPVSRRALAVLKEASPTDWARLNAPNVNLAQLLLDLPLLARAAREASSATNMAHRFAVRALRADIKTRRAEVSCSPKPHELISSVVHQVNALRVHEAPVPDKDHRP